MLYAGYPQLHTIAVREGASNDDLFALAELSFFHGQRSGKESYYLASAVYTYAFLFPEDATLYRSGAGFSAGPVGERDV